MKSENELVTIPGVLARVADLGDVDDVGVVIK